MLIARAARTMHVYRPKRGRKGYGGQLDNLAHNLGDLVNRLQRAANVVWVQDTVDIVGVSQLPQCRHHSPYPARRRRQHHVQDAAAY